MTDLCFSVILLLTKENSYELLGSCIAVCSTGAFCFVERSDILSGVFTLLFVLCLIYHSYTDCKKMLLYDNVNLFLTCVGLLRAYYFGFMISAVQGALVLGGMMLFVYLLSNGGMGEGDVKLAAVLGFWLRAEQGLSCLLLAFIGGAAIGVILLLFKKVKSRQPLPFGPFLCFAAMLCYFWGENILAWYWRLFV